MVDYPMPSFQFPPNFFGGQVEGTILRTSYSLSFLAPTWSSGSSSVCVCVCLSVTFILSSLNLYSILEQS